MKRILFLTTTNLTTNPRCYKEILLAIELGYKPIVVAFYFGGWSAEIEDGIKGSLHGVDIYYIDATMANWWNWLLTGLVQKILSFFPRLVQKNILLQSIVINKRSFQLVYFLKQNKIKADMVIAHNVGAFYPAYVFSKNNNVPLGIDIEDDHVGESVDLSIKTMVHKLMSELLPHANYITFASPLIKQKIVNQMLLPETCIKEVINNVFSKNEFSIHEHHIAGDKLQLVWFSQNIDYGRGVEKFLPILDVHAKSIELTLIGNLRNTFYKNEIEKRNYIKIIAALPQIELHKKLSDFDIGLAIEDPTADENRNICLTNKIWSYFQAGLYIVATNTLAQQQFMQLFEQHGCICSLTGNNIEYTVQKLIDQATLIKFNKQKRFYAAKDFFVGKGNSFIKEYLANNSRQSAFFQLNNRIRH